MRSFRLLVAAAALAAAALATPAYAAVAPPTQREPYIAFTLGDSYASGEGAPDVNGSYNNEGHDGNPKESWGPALPLTNANRLADERCHRSAKAPSGVAIRLLQEDFPDLRVEWESFACSGASIVAGRVFENSAGTDPGGLLRPYRGQDPLKDFDPRPALPAFPAQITQLDSFLDDRRDGARKRIDALLMNIGGNDIGFASFVSYCANIPFTPGEDCHTNSGLNGFRQDGLDLLGARYDRLAASIEGSPIAGKSDPALGYEPASVILTAVPDVARTSNTGFCDATPAGQQEENVKRAESEWLEEQVKTPLNSAIEAATERHGWELADSAVDDFRGHAICNADRWINRNRDALNRQGEDVSESFDVPFVDFSSGWVHPNERGYQQTGGALYEKLAAEAVERFTPTRSPAMRASISGTGGFTVTTTPTTPPSTTSGVYHALKLQRLTAKGDFNPVPGITNRLLEYGSTQETYGGLTGRFVVDGRSCGPLSRDARIGCGPATPLRVSTIRPATPVSVSGGGITNLLGNYQFSVRWNHASALSAHDTQFSRVTVSEVGRSARDGGFSTTVRVESNATSLTDVPGIDTSKDYNVTVQACGAPGIGCSEPSSPVQLDAGIPARPVRPTVSQLQLLDASIVGIAGPKPPCSRAPKPFSDTPVLALPERPGTNGTIELPDTAGDTVPTCLGDPAVGVLSLTPRAATVRAGRNAPLTMGWQHPRRWAELESVSLRLRTSKKVLATLTFDQDENTVRLGRRSVELDGSAHTLRSGGVTVKLAANAFKQPARLVRGVKIRFGLTLPKSTQGSKVQVEMAGRGDGGASQPYAPAGLITVR